MWQFLGELIGLFLVILAILMIISLVYAIGLLLRRWIDGG